MECVSQRTKHLKLSTVDNSICKQKSDQTKTHYSNTKRETLGILHGLEEFYHYGFAHQDIMITDHKPLLAIFLKDVANLSCRL